MKNCFVIQPFDGGKFDKRFKDVYKPALENADITPYRVDQDPEVQVPVETIEERIENSDLCLADITTDNPNVWYELGYAFAKNRPVIMVCGKERKGYPFDIQHRSVISYSSDSSSDFEELKDKITKKARALLKQLSTQNQIQETEKNQPPEEPSKAELEVLLAITMDNRLLPDDPIYLFGLQHSKILHLTPLEFKVAVHELESRGFLKSVRISDMDYGEPENFNGVKITGTGWLWIVSNKDKINDVALAF